METSTPSGIDELPSRPYQVRTAPLLWLALPFAAGIASGYSTQLPQAQTGPLILLFTALAAAGVATLLAFQQGKHGTGTEADAGTGTEGDANTVPCVRYRRSWALLYLCAAFLCGVAYAALREPPAGPYLEVPREAELELRVERLFTATTESDYISGIGRVQQAPAYLPGIEGNRVSFGLRSPARFHTDNPPLVTGAVILAKGRLSDLDAPPPPHRLSRKQAAASPAEREAAERSRQGFLSFIRTEGVRYQLDSGSVLSLNDTGGTWRQLCEHIRSRLKAALRIGADTPQTERLANIGIAMLLGETRALEPDDRQAFAISGTHHLFAVSGLHVVLIAAAFAAVGECLGLRRSRVAVAGIVLLWVYVQVVGAPPSAVRAWWMSALFWAAIACRRQPSSLSALSASMLILLLVQPRQVLNIGFQLSYTVVAGILLYALPLADGIGQWALRQKDRAHLKLRRYPLFPPKLWYRLPPRWQRDALSLFTISLTGTLYSAPLVLGAFGNFAPGGLMINLLLVPLSFWILCALLLCAVLGACGLLWPAALFNHSAWLLLAVMAWAAGLAVNSPLGFYTGLAWNWPFYGTAVCLGLIAVSFFSHSKWLAKRRVLQLTLVPLVWVLVMAIGLIPWK